MLQSQESLFSQTKLIEQKSLHHGLEDVIITTNVASVFTTVLNVDQRLKDMGGSGMFFFNSDLTTVVGDNSANVSRCNTQKYIRW